MRKHIDPAEALPRYYRVAWIDCLINVRVVYPIGIHLVAMVIRRCWELTFWYRPSKLEKFGAEMCAIGYRLGLEYRPITTKLDVEQDFSEMSEQVLMEAAKSLGIPSDVLSSSETSVGKSKT